jgi:hypothetical protein
MSMSVDTTRSVDDIDRVSRDTDLLTALISGLASQQLANDPDGDRWRRLSREAAEMYVKHVTPERR